MPAVVCFMDAGYGDGMAYVVSPIALLEVATMTVRRVVRGSGVFIVDISLS